MKETIKNLEEGVERNTDKGYEIGTMEELVLHEYRRRFSGYIAEAIRAGRKFSRYDGEPPENGRDDI